MQTGRIGTVGHSLSYCPQARLYSLELSLQVFLFLRQTPTQNSLALTLSLITILLATFLLRTGGF